ncbi:uncharacterized protein [Apostichopus japonicus]|uniref:uncharacterized protein isoform X2 n=1 Tax=Stichopus japonicus TaxID=307972 RepID=UPI003AB211F7
MGVSCGFQLEQFFSSDFGWGACFQIKLSFIIFVLVNCSSLESVHSECDFNTTVTDLNHQIGQDATMKCKLPVNLTKSKTACREENLKHLKDNMKYDRRLRSLKGDLVLTVYNLTINDSMIYQCGYEGQDLKIQWICCFNLTISEDNSELEDEDEKEEINEGEEETRTTSFIMTTGPTTRDSTIEPLTGELHCALTNQATYQNVCENENVTFPIIENISKECNKSDDLPSGSSFIFTYRNLSCTWNCFKLDASCNESHVTKVKNPSDTNEDIVNIIFFILCGVMIVLLSLTICLCFYLFADKERTEKVNASSNYSHTLPNVRDVEKKNNNNVRLTSFSSCKIEETEDVDGSQIDHVEIRTLEEGWETNVAYETVDRSQCESDYAVLEEETLQSHESDRESSPLKSKAAEPYSMQSLYESVIE